MAIGSERKPFRAGSRSPLRALPEEIGEGLKHGLACCVAALAAALARPRQWDRQGIQPAAAPEKAVGRRPRVVG